MEVLQHMTPEGLDEYLLVDGALVSPETLAIAFLSHLSMEPETSLLHLPCQTEDLLRSSTLQLVRVGSANCEERK